MSMCFQKPMKDSDDERDQPSKPPARSATSPNPRNAQYEAVLKNIQAQDLKARRRGSLI